MQFKKLKNDTTDAPSSHQKQNKKKNKAKRAEEKEAPKELVPPDPEPPDKPNPLADMNIINLIKQTCVRLMCQEILEINDVKSKSDARPMIQVNSQPFMTDQWLFDTGASITCMSTEKFRSIPTNKRPTKLNMPSRVARAAGGSILIPNGVCLFPLEWNGKKVMQQVHVFRNLSRPLILGIDGIDNLGITYLSRTKSFVFQKAISHKEQF